MPDAIVKGEKNIPVKFHPTVTHFIFECNLCHKDFTKPKSYYEKQRKTRKSACAFCSPGCRLSFYKGKAANGSDAVKTEETAGEKTNYSFRDLIKKIIGS